MAAAIPIVAGAALGGIQHNQKMGQYNRDKQLAADIERNSSWTGVHGSMPSAPGSGFGAMLQGGLGGAMFGNSMGLFGKGAVPDPMAGAQAMGGQQMPGGNQMAGGYEAAPSSWGAPNLFQMKA